MKGIMNVNTLIIGGRLTRDPSLRYLPSQNAVVEFGVAVNRKWRTNEGEDKEEVTYIDVTMFGKRAEVVNQHFQKGKDIFLQGRVAYESWEDKSTGQKRSKLKMVADSFEFVGRDRDDAQRHPDDDGDQRPAPRQQQRSSVGAAIKERQKARGAPPPIGDERHFADSDIPFGRPTPPTGQRWA